jgi:hypothetical protein
MTKPKSVACPALLEYRESDGRTVFYEFQKVLLLPDLQRRCIDKRRLGGAPARLRKAGLLKEVPYIGPR